MARAFRVQQVSPPPPLVVSMGVAERRRWRGDGPREAARLRLRHVIHVASLLGCLVLLACRGRSVPFDSATWKSGAQPGGFGTGPDRHVIDRVAMLDDVCGRVLVKGMSPEAVITLLGPPDRTDARTPPIWTYLVENGKPYLWGGAYGHLTLEFDEAGKLMRWYAGLN